MEPDFTSHHSCVCSVMVERCKNDYAWCVVDLQAMMLDPRLWLGKARILCAAYPDIDWYRVSHRLLSRLVLERVAFTLRTPQVVKRCWEGRARDQKYPRNQPRAWGCIRPCVPLEPCSVATLHSRGLQAADPQV